MYVVFVFMAIWLNSCYYNKFSIFASLFQEVAHNVAAKSMVKSVLEGSHAKYMPEVIVKILSIPEASGLYVMCLLR